jgi:hypothetical protein
MLFKIYLIINNFFLLFYLILRIKKIEIETAFMIINRKIIKTIKEANMTVTNFK